LALAESILQDLWQAFETGYTLYLMRLKMLHGESQQDNLLQQPDGLGKNAFSAFLRPFDLSRPGSSWSAYETAGWAPVTRMNCNLGSGNSRLSVLRRSSIQFAMRFNMLYYVQYVQRTPGASGQECRIAMPKPSVPSRLDDRWDREQQRQLRTLLPKRVPRLRSSTSTLTTP
jgi:hypothetical protein